MTQLSLVVLGEFTAGDMAFQHDKRFVLRHVLECFK